MILQRHRALRLTADLLLHVKRHIQLVRESGLLQLILRCPAFGRLLFASRQWGESNCSGTNGVITFPIAANVKVMFSNDIVYADYTKMDAARVLTIISEGITSSGVKYVVNIENIGSFWWFGIFSTKKI